MSENRGFVSSVSFGRHAYSFGRFRANMPSLHIYICFHTLTGYRAFIGCFTHGCVPKPTKPTKPNEGMRADGRWSGPGERANTDTTTRTARPRANCPRDAYRTNALPWVLLPPPPGRAGQAMAPVLYLDWGEWS